MFSSKYASSNSYIVILRCIGSYKLEVILSSPDILPLFLIKSRSLPILGYGGLIILGIF